MKNSKLILITIITFFFAILLHSQDEKEKYKHQALWIKSEVTEYANDNFGYGVDGIIRTTNEFGEGHVFQRLHRWSIRPWLHFQHNKYLRFSLSPISYFETNEYLGKPDDLNREGYNEIRTTFRGLYNIGMFNNRLTHTFRQDLELRYRHPFSEEYFSFVRYRLRYRLRYNLNNRGYYDKGVYYAYAANDTYVNFGSEVVYNTFNQNRIQLAVGHRYTSAMRFELRYMNRLRARGTGFEYDRTHALMLGVYIDQFSNLYKKDVRPVKFFD